MTPTGEAAYDESGHRPRPRTFYGLRALEPGAWLLAKFIDDVTFDLAATYTLTGPEGRLGCNCPSPRRPCKHVTSIFPRLRPWANTEYWLYAEADTITNPLAPLEPPPAKPWRRL